MTQHAELIRRLETNAALMPSDAAVALEYKAAAEALKEQAVEIERLRKDAERPSVDYVFGKPPKYSLSYTDERDFCLAASPLIGAAYVIGNDAAERINKGPWGRKTFGTVTATIHDAAMPQKAQP